ncbi:hypothetical protein [Polynucleobacter sinensis]|jgi:hypothetical protein|uniref:hypothetical protein n=1 Tax=Polynucleobacter sinensis TaxID=1743157 RepID=UPI0007842F26|nr:hypothetical protein [Polynucleobacter sinensis]
MRIRITNAILGISAGGVMAKATPIEFDPGEYSIHTHPSGHLILELPDQTIGFMKFDDFENGVNAGSILIHA